MTYKPKVGKTLSSSLYRLSDSLWLNEVRENIGKLVVYMEHNDVSEIAKEFPSERFQTKIFGKTFHGKRLQWKFIQAAIAIARIKKQYPEMVKQLVYSGDKVFNQDSLRFIFFKHTDRVWHIPTRTKQRESKTISSFVLLVPSLSRVMSFETPEEDLSYKQFRFGRIQNVQLQGSFGKIRGNAHRKTYHLENSATFKDIKFIFRTIHDAKTIYSAKRLENFSFVTTSGADENSFKTAFYFILVGRVTSYSPFPLKSNMPASMKKISLVDETGGLEFQMADWTINKLSDPMSDSIKDFFQVKDEINQDVLKKNSFAVVLARWSIESNLPEILYFEKLGDVPSRTQLDAFYMLAYLNSRKKVPLQKLEEIFPGASNDDEHFLVDDGYAYMLQFDWDKELFPKILDKAKKTGDFSFLDLDRFPIGLYFHINYDARKLYMSTNPEKDFAQIFNAPPSSWEYRHKPEDFVVIGEKPHQAYVGHVLVSLSKIKKIKLVARGRRITKAVDVAQMIIAMVPDIMIENVKTSSEIIFINERERYLSNISITLAKK